MAGWLRENARAMDHRPAFRIIRAVVKPPDAGVGNRPGTHRARLERHPKVAPIEPIAVKHAGRGANRQNFGMCGRITQPPGCVCRARDHLAIAGDDGTHGHFARIGGLDCGGKGFAHRIGKGKHRGDYARLGDRAPAGTFAGARWAKKVDVGQSTSYRRSPSRLSSFQEL